MTALARGQATVGAGVIIGSNVFNLAALLGLAALAVADRHRAGWRSPTAAEALAAPPGPRSSRDTWRS